MIPIELGLNPDPAEISALIKRAQEESAQNSDMAREGMEQRRAAGKTAGNPRIADVRHLAVAAKTTKAQKDLDSFGEEVANARAAGCSTAREIAGHYTSMASFRLPAGFPGARRT